MRFELEKRIKESALALETIKEFQENLLLLHCDTWFSKMFTKSHS